MPSLFRPDVITISRKEGSGVSSRGQPILPGVVVQTGIPALIDPMLASSRMGGDLMAEVEGTVYIQTHELFLDGLTIQQAFGHNPGDAIVIGGLTYIVAEAGAGAFFDLKQGDDILDQRGRHYLVLAVDQYYRIKPTQQARITFGRSWAGA